MSDESKPGVATAIYPHHRPIANASDVILAILTKSSENYSRDFTDSCAALAALSHHALRAKEFRQN